MLGCADGGDSFLRKDRLCEVPLMAAHLRAAQDEVCATCYRARAVVSATHARLIVYALSRGRQRNAVPTKAAPA